MKKFRFLPAVVAAAILAVAISACGSDDTKTTSAVASKGTPTEEAFLVSMVPHHQSAVQMAALAQNRATHPEVKQLADGIIRAQNTEIIQMKAIHQRLFDTELKPDAEAASSMGMSMDEAGMGMDVDSLRTASPFDRAFIDMMIPHHQGAIRMAQAATKDSKDPEVLKLQAGIIAAQTREIAEMKRWRTAWYGAGRSSTMDDSSGSHGSMDDSMNMDNSG